MRFYKNKTNKIEVIIGVIALLYGALNLLHDTIGVLPFLDWVSIILGWGFINIGLAG